MKQFTKEEKATIKKVKNEMKEIGFAVDKDFILDMLGIGRKELKNYNYFLLKNEYLLFLNDYDIDQIVLKDIDPIYLNDTTIIKESTYLYIIDLGY